MSKGGAGHLCQLGLLILLAMFATAQGAIGNGQTTTQATDFDAVADPSNKGIVLLDQVEGFLRTEPPNEMRDRLFPAVPGDGVPDFAAQPTPSGVSFDKFLSEFYYVLHPVAPEDTKSAASRLKALDRTRLYGCFDRIRMFSVKVERACRYVRAVDLEHGKFLSTLSQAHYKPLTASEQALIDRLRNLTEEERANVSLTDSMKSRDLHMRTGTVDPKGNTIWGDDHFPSMKYRFGPGHGDVIFFPIEWYLALESQHLSRIWLDCSVRVGTGDLPISLPDSFCRPVAIWTTENLYLSTEKKDYVNGAGGWGVSFNHKAFDLSQTLDHTAAATVVARTFVGYITDNFGQSPLSAAVDSQAQMPPQEYVFRRDFQWSNVLNTGLRGPYFERSAYLVQWWTADPWSSPYDVEKNNKGGSMLVQVQHSLQIGKSPGGEFPDPTPDQDAEYTKIVQNLVNGAIVKTTAKLGGQMVDSVGVFKGDLK